jgi:hypothetical protein
MTGGTSPSSAAPRGPQANDGPGPAVRRHTRVRRAIVRAFAAAAAIPRFVKYDAEAAAARVLTPHAHLTRRSLATGRCCARRSTWLSSPKSATGF